MTAKVGSRVALGRFRVSCRNLDGRGGHVGEGEGRVEAYVAVWGDGEGARGGVEEAQVEGVVAEGERAAHHVHAARLAVVHGDGLSV